MRLPVMLILILVSSSALLAGSARAAVEGERKVTVSGECSREAIPDRGAIILVDEFKAADPKSAAAQATRAYEKLKEAVKRLDLADAELKTAEYSVQELREWEKDKTVSKGFRARMGLKVTTSDIPKLGDVIDVATREGVQDVGALTSYLSEEKLRKEKFGCLNEAALDARAKAQRLAETLDAHLDGVLEMSEESAPEAPVRPMMAVARTAGAPAPQVDAGTQTIATSVKVTFRLR